MVVKKVSEIAFAFSHTNLCYVHLWWLLRSASLLEAHCQCTCQHFTLSFHHTAIDSMILLHRISNALLGQLVAFSA